MLIVVYVGLPIKSVYETLKFIAELETSVSELNKIEKTHSTLFSSSFICEGMK